MRYLVIDTCTERGVIAYGSQDKILFERELPFGFNQSKFLLPWLREELKPYGPLPELNGVGAGIGPGSYTGIRIGVAAAQALAYSWRVPLIGVSSLQGYVPSVSPVSFAVVLDARIGGLYFQKGSYGPNDKVHYEGDPQVCSLEEAGIHLGGVSHLVSPSVKSIQDKLDRLYPDNKWIWQEKGPSARIQLKHLEEKFVRGETVMPPQHLDLLYLRQTEAERQQRLKT